MIAMQGGNLVKGFRQWQKEFDRHVKSGEKGIKIFAPAPYKVKKLVDKIDPETRTPILPKSFAVFGVFFLKQAISAVPDSILEAARLDGCGEWKILAKIIIPLLKPSILALTLMIFAGCWSMVEEPLILLQDMGKFPLSVFLDSEVQDVTQSAFIVS